MVTLFLILVDATGRGREVDRSAVDVNQIRLILSKTFFGRLRRAIMDKKQPLSTLLE
jgi:hypothetical protein